MASFRIGLFLFAPVFVFLFLSTPAHCGGEEDSVFKGINSYRQAQNLQPFNQNKKASCLAEEVADEIEDEPCETVNQYAPGLSAGNPKIPNLQKHIDKCDININTTIDGAILPVCVSKLEPTVVLSNYTHNNRYARYLNNSIYTGAGLGSEHDWMVLVLTTNTTTGSFSAATSLFADVGALMGLLMLALLVLMIN
ncbi:hypothetical protein RIF29_24435 [Crotalaria pallida]|uniref:Uncharacterized GPI-anchored protein At5g19230-like domain-containing protein n=1 Tax=Crotalaria pallida TaxID=3830 RepID=A0AAN9HYG1_CROPI